MKENPTAMHWRVESFGQGHMVNLDMQLPDQQSIRLQIHVHLTDRLPVQALKAQALRQALAHIQGSLQSAEQA